MNRRGAGESADAIRSMAGRALASGDIAGAKRLMQRALVQSPGRADILLALGHVQLAGGEFEQATRTARKVLERTPGMRAP